ncbi:MAG TPA: trypsin-like peptidase domain-containing protein [Gemmatimonadaceae bacterium]|nr:trypsin-like peptidase domain-containing protein [Gemmatimonadaceae bacterium]
MSLLSITELQGDLAAVGAALRAVTVVVRNGGARDGGRTDAGGHGSGIVWTADGTIVTNAHVARSPAPTVVLADGRVLRARLVARDPRRDLAVLRIAPEALDGVPLPRAVIGAPRALRPGELVVALGHPFGVAHALSVGVVHAAPGAWPPAATGASPYVCADIRLLPGNSGGPLADARGRVVGVNSMVVGGLGVAISADEVRRLLAALARRDGRRAA